MKQFIEVNDDTTVTAARIEALAEKFAVEPFDLHAVMADGDALIVEVKESGVLVSLARYIVADLNLPNEMVNTMLDGQDATLNRRCLVGRERAIPAVVRFLRTQELPADLGWIPVEILDEWTQLPPPPPVLSDDAILELWHAERRIDAIREYRRAHGSGLKEAMDALQALAQER